MYVLLLVENDRRSSPCVLHYVYHSPCTTSWVIRDYSPKESDNDPGQRSRGRSHSDPYRLSKGHYVYDDEVPGGALPLSVRETVKV